MPTIFQLVAYALPAFGLAVLYLPLFQYVTPFYVTERGVDIALLGAAWIAIRLFDAVSDPIMGWLSDRTPARWGRRRVWMAVSVPLLIIATWQTFVPPEDAGLGHAVLWLFLLTLGWTMAQTPYAAWGAELAQTETGRTRVTLWREAVVLMGTLGATIAYFQGGEGGGGLEVLASIVFVAVPLGILATILAVPDRAKPGRTFSMAEVWSALASNRAFLRLLVAWFINGLSNALPVSLFLFFVFDRLQAGDVTVDADGTLPVAAASLLLYFLAAILAMPLWGWAARRLGKARAWGVAMIWAALVFAGCLFLGAGDWEAYLLISVLTGAVFGADLALPPSIQADVVAEDTARTGAARAGLFFAIWQVATKAALALASGIALIILGAVGFEAGADNAPMALTTLSLLYAGVPIVLKLFVVALMWRFRASA